MTLPATGGTADAERRLAHLPLTFVPNGGQTDPAVRFQADPLGGTLFFTPSQVVLALPQTTPSTRPQTGRDYSFQNTTGAVVNGTLTLLNASGTVVTTFDVSIPAGRAGSTNTLALGIARNQTGTARFIHDGPPGAVIAEAAIASFSSNPAYVQPVKFQAVREATH